MTRAKSTKSYPRAYLEMSQVLSKNPELRIEIPFKTKGEAESFRLDFNSFKGAALREKLDDMFPEIAAFYVTIEGSTATVQHKDHTETSKAIAAAISKAEKGK